MKNGGGDLKRSHLLGVVLEGGVGANHHLTEGREYAGIGVQQRRGVDVWNEEGNVVHAWE